MNKQPLLTLAALVLGAVALVGCGADANQPQTLEQQKKLMDGTYKPTKEQLDSAMNNISLPTPGANEGSRTPPPGAIPPDAQKPKTP